MKKIEGGVVVIKNIAGSTYAISSKANNSNVVAFVGVDPSTRCSNTSVAPPPLYHCSPFPCSFASVQSIL